MASSTYDTEYTVNISVCGTTGAGKSKLCNLLADVAENGEKPVGLYIQRFKEGAGFESTTQEIQSQSFEYRPKGGSWPSNLVFKVTVHDAPGIPDTNNQKNVDHYNAIIGQLRKDMQLIVFIQATGKVFDTDKANLRPLFAEINKSFVAKLALLNNVKAFDETAPDHADNVAAHQKDLTTFASQVCPKLARCFQLYSENAKELRVLASRILQDACRMPPLATPDLRSFDDLKEIYAEKTTEADKKVAARKELERSIASAASRLDQPWYKTLAEGKFSYKKLLRMSLWAVVGTISEGESAPPSLP
eukprot:4317254-Pleurochrysis_carterae.AAC.1